MKSIFCRSGVNATEEERLYLARRCRTGRYGGTLFTRGLAMKHLLPLALASFAMIGAAQAQTIGTATTDLNIRSGPGPEQPAIGLMRSRQSANILGCIEGSLWCQVEFRGMRGWAYSQYMTLNTGGRRILVTEPANVRSVPIVAYDGPAAPVVASPGIAVPRAPVVTYRAPIAAPGVAVAPAPRVVETTGAAPIMASDEALIAPSGNVVVGASIAPPPAVGTYVTTNPGDPVSLSGDVVVGAGMPQSVALNPVPDYRYQYVYVNETPVLVDPATRRIVYVFR
jgi:uncharacterized protein YraI